jgi:hypothetical protein
VVHNCFAQCANRHVDICAGLAVCTMNNEASLNPYATPRAVVADPGASEVEIVRKEHITHEASVKSAGLLFMLGGLVTLAAAASLVIPAMAVAGDRSGFLVIGMAVAGLGRMVLSAEYASIIEATPQIRYRTSIAVWIGLGLLVLLAVLGFFAAALG